MIAIATRRAKLLSGSAAVALLLAACNGAEEDEGAAPDEEVDEGVEDEDDEDDEEEPAADDEPVTLDVNDNAVRGGQNANIAEWMVEDVIPEFEQQMADEGRDVTINYIESAVDDFQTELALDLSVGSGPDVFTVDQFWVADLVAAGYLAPLSEVVGDEVEDWEGWEDMPEAVEAGFMIGDDRFGLPLGTDGRVLFFRSDLFEEAGLDPDWQPESWDDILETARTLQAELDDVTPMQLNAGVSYEEATAMQGTLPILLGTGEEVWTEEGWLGDNPALVETFGFYEELYSEELADLDLQLASQGRDQSFEQFSQGQVAILLEGDFFWRAVINPDDGTFPIEDRDDVVGWAAIPAQEPGAGINGQDFVSASGGNGRTINPETDHPDVAWEFLEYTGSQEALEAFVEREPRITASEQINEVAIGDDPLLSFIAEEVLPITWYRPGFEEYPQVSDTLVEMTEDVVAGRRTPEEASAEFGAQVEGLVGGDDVR